MNLKTILRSLPALSIAITGISLVFSLSSCEPPDELSTDVNVYTEEIVFTSGESAIMTGRVLAQGAVQVTDHGFHIDTTDAFLNPIVISLGERNIPGRFVGEVHQLNIRNNYYCRAFWLKTARRKRAMCSASPRCRHRCSIFLRRKAFPERQSPSKG